MPEPEPKKPMHWITKSALLASGAVILMYAHAWLTDSNSKLLAGHVGATTSIVMFFVIFGLSVAAFLCAITKGRFS